MTEAEKQQIEMLMLHCRYVNITVEAQAERYFFPDQVARFKQEYTGH